VDKTYYCKQTKRNERGHRTMNTIGALIGIYVAFRLIKQGIEEVRKLD
jgi:hypothetical protein